MNRRNFFKVVTGFVAGIFATSTKAEEKPQLTVAMLKKVRDELVAAQKVSQDIYGDPDILCKRPGTRYVCVPKSGPPDWTDVRDFGANDDTEMIQEAIDLAAKDGGGIVYFPKGTYNLKYGIIV
jgi:hypothetical protein